MAWCVDVPIVHIARHTPKCVPASAIPRICLAAADLQRHLALPGDSPVTLRHADEDYNAAAATLDQSRTLGIVTAKELIAALRAGADARSSPQPPYYEDFPFRPTPDQGEDSSTWATVARKGSRRPTAKRDRQASPSRSAHSGGSSASSGQRRKGNTKRKTKSPSRTSSKAAPRTSSKGKGRRSDTRTPPASPSPTPAPCPSPLPLSLRSHCHRPLP